MTSNNVHNIQEYVPQFGNMLNLKIVLCDYEFSEMCVNLEIAYCNNVIS